MFKNEYKDVFGATYTSKVWDKAQKANNWSMAFALLYALSKKARGLPVLVVDGLAGVSGIAWCIWIIGFLLFFVAPQYWLLSLFLAACGLLLKVASKIGLIGLLMREDIDKE